MKGGAIRWRDAIAPVMGYVDGFPSAAFTISGELRKGEPIYNTRDAHVHSEGGSMRAFGVGGLGTAGTLMIVGLVLLAGVTVGTFIMMNNSMDALKTQNQTLKDQLANLYNLLLNMSYSRGVP
jgi:hypothetical protein